MPKQFETRVVPYDPSQQINFKGKSFFPHHLMCCKYEVRVAYLKEIDYRDFSLNAALAEEVLKTSKI